MPRFILKHKGMYCEWSTIVDAPVTYFYEREDFVAFYRDKYGWDGMRELGPRLERADRQGTSSMVPCSAEDLAALNRAGDDGVQLSLDEIFDRFQEPNGGPEVGWSTEQDVEMAVGVLADRLASKTTLGHDDAVRHVRQLFYVLERAAVLAMVRGFDPDLAVSLAMRNVELWANVPGRRSDE